jgi:hypothetical protein
MPRGHHEPMANVPEMVAEIEGIKKRLQKLITKMNEKGLYGCARKMQQALIALANGSPIYVETPATLHKKNTMQKT